jgi:murein DD-endopeptidase MepM/ murein hydrolase activator NlpD
LEENGATLDITTQAGRDNEAALDAMSDAALGVTQSTEFLNASEEEQKRISGEMRAELIRMGTRYGLTEQAAEDYADQILAIPKTRTTTPTFADAEASRKVKAFKELLAGIDETVGVRVNVGGLGGLGGFFTSGSSRPGGFPWMGSYPRTQGPHDGGAIDYGMPVGTPLRATFPGYFDATNLGNRSYGMYYTLRGGGKYELLAHMSRFARGDGYVSTGSLLGWSGNSGNSTGPHAHLLRNFHTGGMSPGGPINTLRGEYVTNPSATAANRGLLEAINAGRVGGDSGPMRLDPKDITAIGRVIAAEMTVAVGAGAYSASQRSNLYARAG